MKLQHIKNAHYITGEITSFQVQYILNYLNDNKRPIFVISSSGGNADASLALYYYIKALEIDITAYVFGHCESAAVQIFMACTKRYATKGSRIMLHKPTVNKKWYQKKDEINLYKKEYEQFKKEYNLEDKVYSTEEALENNIIHGII